MNDNAQDHKAEQNKAGHIQDKVPVGTDHIRIIQYGRIEESQVISPFLRLIAVERRHENGIPGMAFYALLYGL